MAPPPPASQITPPPIPFNYHQNLRRADDDSFETKPYIPSPGLLSSATTWLGRPQGEWDLPYFPLWNTASSYSCPNSCLWGGAETVDNYVDCQNDKRCVCKEDTLSTAVVWAKECVERKCLGDARPQDGVGYVQTLIVVFCENAWRETGSTLNFEIPKSIEGQDTIEVRGTTWGAGTGTGTGTVTGNGQNTNTANTSIPTSDDSSDNNNIALKAGLGAGIPLAIIFLAALTLFFVRKHRTRQALQHWNPPQEVLGDLPSPSQQHPGGDGGWQKYGPGANQHLWVQPPPVEIGDRKSVVGPPDEVSSGKLEENRKATIGVEGRGGGGGGRGAEDDDDDWSVMRRIPA